MFCLILNLLYRISLKVGVLFKKKYKRYFIVEIFKCYVIILAFFANLVVCMKKPKYICKTQV